LHRQILLSAVYQQAVEHDAAKAQVDPENRLLWRMRTRRIEAEVLRDAILEVSGRLNRLTLGPRFKPPIADEAKVARNLKTPYPADVKDDHASHRRSIYMFHKRVIPYPLLAAFDRPDSLQSCSRRDSTTVAPQALALLNDPFVRARSLDFADRLLRETQDSSAAVHRAFFCLGARACAQRVGAECRAAVSGRPSRAAPSGCAGRRPSPGAGRPLPGFDRFE
jgi:hypothetical protein